MGDQPRTVTFPRRDARGRIQGFAELLGAALVWLLVGLAVLVAIDGLVSLLGDGRFGRTSGWISGILVVWLYVEEYRAWRPIKLRPAIAAVGGAIGLLAGLIVSGLATTLPAIVTGTVAVAVASGVYGTIWFYGVRRVAAGQYR